MSTKQTLKRIEATLQQLNDPQPTLSKAVAASLASGADLPPSPSQSPANRPQAKASPQPCSFEIRLDPSLVVEPQADETKTDKSSVQTFPVQENERTSPALPKLKTPSFSTHRNSANPALAAGLLKDIQAIVLGWQRELQQILKQIQKLYADGPLLDGWLESHARQPEPGEEALRPAAVDRLMNYINENCSELDDSVSCQSPRTGYRLCGLREDGQLWSHPCPPEQVPSVSLAIARYQKLRQLLGRKEYLEVRLNQLAETLTVLHSHLKSS